MKEIRALHLASFDGNIGDNANHAGFYAGLARLNHYSFGFEPLEIREFYWQLRAFDESFVERVNSYDMLVVGGGNYFELWVEHSPTGTSFMLAPELFKQIKVPVLFNALGVDPGQGASEQACTRFRFFLDHVLSDPKNMVSIRNDGSLEALNEYIGSEYAQQCIWTPDAGCFVPCSEPILHLEGDYLAVNLAGDMLDQRFTDTDSYTRFLSGLVKLLERYLNQGLVQQIVLVPHIFRDLRAISDLLEQMDDAFRRRSVIVAPLLHGPGSEQIFSLYAGARLSLCTRFHANLCSIAQGTPTIGLVNYRQIEKLYEEMGLSEFAVAVNEESCFETIEALSESLLSAADTKHALFNQKANQARKEYAEYIQQIGTFLDKNFME